MFPASKCNGKPPTTTTTTSGMLLSGTHPQGSPASPAITNLLCRRLDRRLTAMAENLGFTYTRYPDDLTFSASGDSLRHICNILKRTDSIVTHEGFVINQEKNLEEEFRIQNSELSNLLEGDSDPH